MADKAPVTSINKRKDFDKQLKEEVYAAYERINELKADRSAINEQMQSEFSKLEGKGFNKKGLKAAFAYLDMDDEKRDNFDHSFVFMRNAGGQPLQGELFDANMSAVFARQDEPEQKMQKA